MEARAVKTPDQLDEQIRKAEAMMVDHLLRKGYFVSKNEPKVLVEVEDGIVQNVSVNMSIRVIVKDVDKDIESETDVFPGVSITEWDPTIINGFIYDLFDEEDPEGKAIIEHFKKENF